MNRQIGKNYYFLHRGTTIGIFFTNIIFCLVVFMSLCSFFVNIIEIHFRRLNVGVLTQVHIKKAYIFLSRKNQSGSQQKWFIDTTQFIGECENIFDLSDEKPTILLAKENMVNLRKQFLTNWVTICYVQHLNNSR